MLSVPHGFNLRSLPPGSSLRALVLQIDESRRGPLDCHCRQHYRARRLVLATLSRPASLAPAAPPAVRAYARAPALLALAPHPAVCAYARAPALLAPVPLPAARMLAPPHVFPIFARVFGSFFGGLVVVCAVAGGADFDIRLRRARRWNAPAQLSRSGCGASAASGSPWWFDWVRCTFRQIKSEMWRWFCAIRSHDRSRASALSRWAIHWGIPLFK